MSGDIDAIPIEGSTNPVQSGGMYSILERLFPNSSLFGGFVAEYTPVSEDKRLYFLTEVSGDLPNFELYNLPDNGKWKIIKWNPRDAAWDWETIDSYTSAQIDQFFSAVAAAISGKQDTISDLATIRSGAAAGATALQSSDITPIENAISIIESVIPAQASVQNQLADKNFVNSQVITASANFVGTFETLAELQAVQNPTKNDYGFVIETDALGNQYYDRYKYNGTVWLFEYKVESTSFTSEQWAAIQSGITSAIVQKINDVIPSNASSSNKLATTSDVNEKLDAPETAGTSGQVLTSDGQGGQSWQTPQSGVSSYNDLNDKPQINSVTLSGNKSASDLGLATAAQGTKADTAVQQTDGVAYVGDVVNSASTVGFDPQSDTVWNKEQILSSAQKAQARTNIAAQEALVSGTNIKTINNESILGSGNINIQGGGGGGASQMSNLSDVNISSPSNGQALLYDSAISKWVNGNVSGGGSVTLYTADWIASTSSANGTILTDILNLPQGIYLVRIQFPVFNNTTLNAQIDGTNISQRANTYHNGSNYSIFVDFVEVLSGGGTIKVISASAAQHTMTYLERGSLQALKIS